VVPRLGARVRRAAGGAAPQRPAAIGRLDGNLWSGATLTDVRITQDGREVVRVERVRVTYSVRQLLSRHWRFPRSR
jgi:hypothetical protein